MKPKLSELLLASFKFEEYNPLHTKVLLLNALLFIAVVTNLVFGVINHFITGLYQVALVNLFIFMLLVYALYVLRKKQDYDRAAYIGNIVLFIGFLVMILLQHGKNFTLIWTLFFAPFAIFTLGAVRGLVATFVFIVTVLAVTYTGIGSWQDGVWNTQSYLRYSVAHFVMLYAVFAVQNSSEKADEKIEQMRYKEKEQLRLLKKLSVTDALTSLYNRRFLDEIFLRQLHSAKRNTKLFAFFILDLDYFKQYNDTYGHQKGDWVLKQIANILKEHLRRSDDYAFRLGGEEFAGIIMTNEIEGIHSRIKAIHEAVMEQEIEHSSSEVKPIITCSIGTFVLEDDYEYDFNEIYKFADDALYQAKNSSRNQIVYTYQNGSIHFDSAVPDIEG